jgi:crotonobetainyl-CoA:carnitine CoA-transferase CaiB-like acyl-CoA transferase
MSAEFEEIMGIRARGMPPVDEVQITGTDAVFSTPFQIGSACANVLAGVGVAVSDIWEQKTGQRQHASIDVRHAAATLRSSLYLQSEQGSGEFATFRNPSMSHMISLTQPWPTRDGRWFLPHFNLPHLQARVLGVLGCEPTPESAAAAVLKWDALDLEAAIDEAGACGAMVRSNDEWLAHPHGQALAAMPLVQITKVADSDPEPFPEQGPPLAGIRVLDLTRILAGPMAARTLAEHGADVLMVTAQHLPQVKEHVLDTSHGKRSCFLDLQNESDRAQLEQLVDKADVFSQGYRPGVMAKFGFSPEQLAARRPGIVSLSISCFGPDGPFSHRPGWEQIAQTVTGICDEGSPARPTLLPASACDYTTGFLGAYGVLLALERRAREGGSYHVQVSLCQSGMFIYRHGKVNFDSPDMDLSAAELDALRIHSETGHGALRHLGPVLKLSKSNPGWSRPTPVLGEHAAQWAT